MESWSYVSGEKNFVSEESVCASDGIPRGSKNGLMGWELKSSSSFENISLMCSSQEGIKNQEFVELGCSSDMMRKSLVNDSITEVLSSQYGCGGRRVYNPITALPPNAVVYGEEESSSKLSSSIVDSNCRDSSLIDLKLGRFLDHKDASSTKVSNPNFSSAESPIPPKRARPGSLNSQTSFCQVHGCKKDLSSSKDYHKRHKVCEIHSKTAKVIVNGIEQRFCQQCSRFHFLAEFDDGKRSCRKRLAGHNERRRKPRSVMHSGRAGGMFQSYNGSRYQGANTFALSSFVCQDILPGNLVHQQKYEMNDWYRNVKVEDEAGYSPQLEIPNTKGETHSKSHMTSFNTEKHCYPSMHDDGLIAVTRSKMHENSNSSLHNMSTSDFDSSSLFLHNSSLGSEELTVLDSTSTVQGIPRLSNAGCALSLLSSSRSQNSSNQPSGIPNVLPLISPGCHSHYNVTQVSEKLTRASPQTSTSGVSNAFHPSGITSNEDTQMEPILISDGIDSVSYGINGIIHGSGYMNTKDNVSCGNVSTIDLLQLSSQLQRVEHQRQSMQVKQETDAFFGLRIT